MTKRFPLSTSPAFTEIDRPLRPSLLRLYPTHIRIPNGPYPFLCGYSASYKRCLYASIRFLSAFIRCASEPHAARYPVHTCPSASPPLPKGPKTAPKGAPKPPKKSIFFPFPAPPPPCQTPKTRTAGGQITAILSGAYGRKPLRLPPVASFPLLPMHKKSPGGHHRSWSFPLAPQPQPGDAHFGSLLLSSPPVLLQSNHGNFSILTIFDV